MGLEPTNPLTASRLWADSGNSAHPALFRIWPDGRAFCCLTLSPLVPLIVARGDHAGMDSFEGAIPANEARPCPAWSAAHTVRPEEDRLEHRTRGLRAQPAGSGDQRPPSQDRRVRRFRNGVVDHRANEELGGRTRLRPGFEAITRPSSVSWPVGTPQRSDPPSDTGMTLPS